MTAPSGEQFEIPLRRPARGRRRGRRRPSVVLGRRSRRRRRLRRRRDAARRVAGQVLIPWPNRLEDGSYEFDGRRHQLPLDRAGERTRSTASSAGRRGAWPSASRIASCWSTFSIRSPGYPFSLALAIEYALSDDGLRVTTTATNVGADACPYGSGAHPYLELAARDGRRSSCSRPRRGRCSRSDDRGIPVGTASVDGDGARLPDGRGRSARRGSTTASRTSSAATTVSRASSSTPRRVSRSTLWVDETHPLPDAVHG